MNEEPEFRIYETLGYEFWSWDSFFTGRRFGLVAIILEKSL